MDGENVITELWRYNPQNHTVYRQSDNQKTIQTKYKNYDQERIALGGNDWAKFWREGKVFSN